MGQRRSESRSAGGRGLPDDPSSLLLASLGAQLGLSQGEGAKPYLMGASAAKRSLNRTHTPMCKLTNLMRGHHEHLE